MSISNLIDSERTVYIRLRDRATQYRFMSDAEREGITYSDGSSPTELAVEDIIAAVGYDNNSYFHRIFKERYSMTPKKYRDAESTAGKKNESANKDGFFIK